MGLINLSLECIIREHKSKVCTTANLLWLAVSYVVISLCLHQARVLLQLFQASRLQSCNG